MMSMLICQWHLVMLIKLSRFENYIELFVWIVVILISFVGAVSIVDFRNVKKKG